MAKHLGKQVPAPGFEQKTVKAVDDAAEAYQELREQQAALGKQVKAAHDALVLQMEKNSIERYTDKTAVPPLDVRLDRTPKAKVKKLVEKKRRGRKNFA